ncbi:MAG: MFS transporter [Candidatus Pacebacteria bacterium]|nr:MFS transporter [Candidatus Paceibacterota bacterium]
MDKIAQFGATAFASLSVQSYRRLFVSQAIALSGTWMQIVALGWLGLQLTGSGSQLGLIVAAQFLPLLLFAPWGGLLADRNDKKKILQYTQYAYVVTSIVLGVLVVTGVIQVWMLYVFALLLGVVRVFEMPARQTIVSELVSPDHLKNAISLNASVNNLARAIGPSIGGIVIAGAGIGFCFFFNALTYLVAIFVLRTIKDSDITRSAFASAAPGQLRAGWRYAWETPLIRDLLIMIALIGTFTFEFQISLALLAKDTFGSDATGYAALMSAFGAGAAVGGIIAASRKETGPAPFLGFGALSGFSILLASVAPSLGLAIAGMVLVGFFTVNMVSTANSMIQMEAHPDMRGRVMAIWGMAMMGSTPIGGPIIGWIGEYTDARVALATGGAFMLIAVVYGYIALVRRKPADHMTADTTIKLTETHHA